jgi:hypothetical protein
MMSDYPPADRQVTSVAFLDPPADSTHTAPAAPRPVGREFILAGNAIFTITNDHLNRRFTYRVTRKKADLEYGERFFVSVLTGPNNLANYTYLGLLDPTSGRIVLTNGSQFIADAAEFRVVQAAVDAIWKGQPLTPTSTIHHEGKCGRCGRPLTVPRSIDGGFGPVCARRVAKRRTQDRHQILGADSETDASELSKHAMHEHVGS